MTRDDILALADRVEALTGPCSKADDSIVEILFALQIPIAYYGGPINYDPSAWQERHGFSPTSSLDAAMGLVPDGWSHMEVYGPDHQTLGWTVHIMRDANLGVEWSGFAQTHASALAAASLRAIAQGMDA